MADKITTQQQHPIKAALRTFAQVWLPGILLALLVVPQIVQAILDEAGGVLPDGVRLVLAGVITVFATVSAVLARIMAIPAVDAFLKRFGFGSEPRTAPVSADGVADITTLSVDAPAGFEVSEVSAAKTEVADEVRDLLEYHLDDVEPVYRTSRDPIGEADKIVERLLELGWRPTAESAES